jgi:hypothetical protein
MDCRIESSGAGFARPIMKFKRVVCGMKKGLCDTEGVRKQQQRNLEEESSCTQWEFRTNTIKTTICKPKRKIVIMCGIYPDLISLWLAHNGTLVAGKFKRIWGFHSLPTTSDCQLIVSTHSCLMRGTPNLGNTEGTYDDQGLTEVTLGEPRKTDAQQASRGCPTKAANSMQRVVTCYLPILTEVVSAFPKLKCKCQVIIERRTARLTSIIEAFTWNDPPKSHRKSAREIQTLLGSTSRHPSNRSSFRKGQIAWWDHQSQ